MTVRIQVFTHHHKASLFIELTLFISFLHQGSSTHYIKCLIHNKMCNISCLIIIIISVHCVLEKYLVEFDKAITVKKKEDTFNLTGKNQQLWLSEIHLVCGIFQ